GGLVGLACGDEGGGLAEVERELSFEHGGQLYARECAANTWYAIGALSLRRGRRDDARDAFVEATRRVPSHPMAAVGLGAAGALDTAAIAAGSASISGRHQSAVDAALADAARLVLPTDHDAAGRPVGDALAAAPPGNAAWILPVEPLLQVTASPRAWTLALARLRNRAA